MLLDTMRRRIGWAVLSLIWAGVALRTVFPTDTLHSGYPPTLNLLLFGVDLVLMMPPWFLLQTVVGHPEADWPYWASSAVYLLGLSMLIYHFLIKNRERHGGSHPR